jgi:hypothetical protein
MTAAETFRQSVGALLPSDGVLIACAALLVLLVVMLPRRFAFAPVVIGAVAQAAYMAHSYAALHGGH